MAIFNIIISVLLCLNSAVIASGEVSGAQDITSLLTTSSGIHLTEASKNIIHTMSTVAQLPSCNKIASAALINSCSELDTDSTLGVGQTVDVMLEKSKSIYAARLAICELDDAHAYIPDACSAFKPNQRTTWKSYIMPGRRAQHPSYDHETAQQLDRCLKSLSSKPQTWTSYSNAKQNAIVMCHAMRASIEKDEKLEIFQMMVELNEQTMGSMATATRDFESFLKDFDIIRKDMQSFQMSLNEGIVEITELLEKHWANIRGNVQDLDHAILTTLEKSRQTTVNLDHYRDQSNTAHDEAIKALMAMAAIVDATKQSSMSSLDLQTNMNKHLVDALNLTIAASKSASSVDAVMVDLMLRLNDTVGVVENLNNFLFIPTDFAVILSSRIGHALLGSTVTSPSGVSVFFLATGVLSISLGKWGPKNWFAHSMIAIALASTAVRVTCAIPSLFAGVIERFLTPLGLILWDVLEFVYISSAFGKWFQAHRCTIWWCFFGWAVSVFIIVIVLFSYRCYHGGQNLFPDHEHGNSSQGFSGVHGKPLSPSTHCVDSGNKGNGHGGRVVRGERSSYPALFGNSEHKDSEYKLYRAATSTTQRQPDYEMTGHANYLRDARRTQVRLAINNPKYFQAGGGSRFAREA